MGVDGSLLTGVEAKVTSKDKLGLFKNCEGLNGNCFIGVFFTGVEGSVLGTTLEDWSLIEPWNKIKQKR